MTTITRIGIIIFAIAVLFGPIYTVVDYSVVSNLISELGAQHTKNNFIMIIAFFILGGSIAFDGIKNFQISLLPFIVFGLAMAVVSVFPHKPLDPSLEYNQTYQKLHGLIASIAGTAVTVGFIWRGLQTEKRNKLICFYMAIVAIVFPVLMVSFPKYKGIIQRAMYLQILGWLWIKYPNTWLTKRFS